MKRPIKNLYLYSLAIIVVAMVFIVIGGISLSKNVTKEDNQINLNLNAKDKVIALNEENLKLLTENKELKEELESLKSENEQLKIGVENYLASNSVLEAEAMIESKDYENAKILLEEHISKEYLTGFAKGKYERLLEIVKENTK